ncbi:GH25 family lysozyme [Enterococcus saccharolyticus]|uniref:GH25 family lysozyme n=1 Tax=Enterococcus saccharolyticus TaxID=41997 RepID=UPI0039DF94C7
MKKRKRIIVVSACSVLMLQPLLNVYATESTNEATMSTEIEKSFEVDETGEINQQSISDSSIVEQEMESIKSEQISLTESTGSASEESLDESHTVLDDSQKTEESATIESTTETIIPELKSDEEYIFPSGRSDLNNMQAFSASLAIPHVSATDTNLPKKSFIDISSHNGYISVENFKIIKSYGVDGVVVKLTEATSYQNPYAKDQIKNALAAGMKVSVYHYSWFKTKDQAKKEADYFAAMANSLGLPKDTLMVNDIEEPKIAEGNNHTQNSLEFEQRLNELGFMNVNHYVGMHWITSGKIDSNILGNRKLWVAAYPYVLSTTQRYTEYGAWQWSSQMTFPNVPGIFDISSDYHQNFINQLVIEDEKITDFQEFNYAMIKKNVPLWQLDNQEVSSIGNTQNLLNQTLKINSLRRDSNQTLYYLLETNTGDLLGYVKANDVEGTNNAYGEYKKYNKYVTIQSGNYDIWQNFNWQKRSHSANYQGQLLQARGYYDHFNGTRYLTLYDQAGKWVGYLDVAATKLSSNGGGGKYHAYNKYVTIQSGNYDIWQNFDWQKRSHSANYQGQLLQARGYYDHFNGTRYLTIYDKNGKWIGYINATATKLSSNGGGGKYRAYNKYVTIQSPNYDIWQNFDWQKRSHSANYHGQLLQARGYYDHFNGTRYLTIYDKNGKWVGYINATATKLSSNGGGGKYHAYNKYVTIQSGNYDIWQNFDWQKRSHSSKYQRKTVLARGYYDHFNGARYLSLYENNGHWIGYINETGTKLGPEVKEKMAEVQQLLNQQYYSANYGIYVMSLIDGSVAQKHGSKIFHAASTGKLPALYYTQKMISDKKLNGETLYLYTDSINTMSNSYMRGGAGILQGQSFGKKYSLNTIMNWTAKYSDNQGANFLGYYGANKYDTTMKQEISAIMKRNWTNPFYVSAKDNAFMMQAIYHQGGKLITDLSNTVYDQQRIPKYIPVQVAHKIGDLNSLAHDAAIIYAEQPYILVVMTENGVGYEVISQLSKQIYDRLK